MPFLLEDSFELKTIEVLRTQEELFTSPLLPKKLDRGSVSRGDKTPDITTKNRI